MNKSQVIISGLLGLGLGLFIPGRSNAQTLAQALLIATPSVFFLYTVSDTKEQQLKNRIDLLEGNIEKLVDNEYKLVDEISEKLEREAFLSELVEEKNSVILSLIDVNDKMRTNIQEYCEIISEFKHRINSQYTQLEIAYKHNAELKEKIEALEKKVGYRVVDNRSTQDVFRCVQTGEIFTLKD